MRHHGTILHLSRFRFNIFCTINEGKKNKNVLMTRLQKKYYKVYTKKHFLILQSGHHFFLQL
jgi:hypothetical protein